MTTILEELFFWNSIWADPEKAIVTWRRIQNFVIALTIFYPKASVAISGLVKNFSLWFQDGPFEWGQEVTGVILSSYFFGYLVSQVPGGRAAEVFSAKWILFASVALNIVPTIFTPPAAMLHWSLLVVLRIIEGVGGVSNVWQSSCVQPCLLPWIISNYMCLCDTVHGFYWIWTQPILWYMCCMQIWPELSNSFSVMNFIDFVCWFCPTLLYISTHLYFIFITNFSSHYNQQ